MQFQNMNQLKTILLYLAIGLLLGTALGYMIPKQPVFPESLVAQETVLLKELSKCWAK